MRNGNKFTMATPNTETLGSLLSQLGGILGVGRRSDGKYHLSDMCTASSIKIGAKYKPVRHSAEANITEAQRRSANWGMLAKDNASIKANFINVDSEFGAVFSSYTLEKWEHETPRGTSVSPTEWSRIRDFNGYNHTALPPLAITSSAISVNMNNGQLENINANVNGNSQLQYGNISNIELMIADLNFRHSWSSISDNVLDGNWRLAVAIRMPRSGGYRWLIASSVRPLEVFANPENQENYLAHRIMLNVGNFGARLRNLARQAKVATFECVPILAYGLNYTDARGWTWSGDATNKAITFPNADKFSLTLTGFATTINITEVSTILRINGTQATPIAGSGGVGLRIARSIAAAATSAEVTFRFRVTSCFGVNTSLKGVSNMGAYTPTSLSGKGASGTSTFNAEGLEWNGVNEEYTMTFNDASLVSVLRSTASQSSMGNIGSAYNVGLQFVNSVLSEQMNFSNLVSFTTIAFS